VDAAVQGTDAKALLDAIAGGRSLAAHFHKEGNESPSQDPMWVNLLDFWLSVDPQSNKHFKTAEELCRHPFVQQYIFDKEEIRELLSAEGMVIQGNEAYSWGKAASVERLHTVSLRWGPFGVEMHAVGEIPVGGLVALYSGPHFVKVNKVGGQATPYSHDPFTRFGFAATNSESHVDASVTPAWPMTKCRAKGEPMTGGFANSSAGTREAPNLSNPAFESWYGKYPCQDFRDAFAAAGCKNAVFAMRACGSEPIAHNAKLRWSYTPTLCTLRFEDWFTVRFDSDAPAS
jgi:hypothetical protein